MQLTASKPGGHAWSVPWAYEFTVKYQELRGYSIALFSLDGTASRTLLLYPRTDVQFSIGIPDRVGDEVISPVACASDGIRHDYR
jgi:hypothetical protein